MNSFISEVYRIAALNLGELRRIVDCSIWNDYFYFLAVVEFWCYLF